MSDHQVNLTRLRERAERAIAREEASLARDGGASTGLESRQLVKGSSVRPAKARRDGKRIVCSETTKM